MSNPPVDHRTHAVPRSEGEGGDYEDAAAVAAERWPVFAAVADGATESVFAREWAERLAQGIVEAGTTPEVLRDAVPNWQAEWQADVSERVAERPWYVGAKAVEGAFAAVLGLSLHADGQWRAVSVGDCCLFHVRDGGLVRSWPFETADAFTNRPALVPSRSSHDVPPPDATTGSWQSGDQFVLATDAVAAWLLDSEPAGMSTLDPDAFRDKIETARKNGALRNDDATLLVLELAASPEPNEDASASS